MVPSVKDRPGTKRCTSVEVWLARRVQVPKFQGVQDSPQKEAKIVRFFNHYLIIIFMILKIFNYFWDFSKKLYCIFVNIVQSKIHISFIKSQQNFNKASQFFSSWRFLVQFPWEKG